MSLPMIPGTLPTGTVRRRPWKEGSRTMRVPLLQANAFGEQVMGLIKVPVHLAGAPPHTNLRLEFERFLTTELGRWVEWRSRRGWEIVTRPKITGPFEPQTDGQANGKAQMERAISVIGRSPSARPAQEPEAPEDVKWYWVQARFRRAEPVYARLDDVMELKRIAQINNVDTNVDAHPWNDVGEGPDEITVEGGVDIMADAERRRQAAGKKRSDYLFGPLEEPL